MTDNLLTNARSHTPDGTPVHVRVFADDAMAVLEVEDEGSGIAPEDAGRIFEPFYRADPSRSRERGGAGLGLSIVVAEAHRGSAELVRGGHGGACFRVEIPIADALPPPPRGPGPRLPRSSKPLRDPEVPPFHGGAGRPIAAASWVPLTPA